MDNILRVSQIGLSAREVTVLRSMFGVLPQLKGGHVFIDLDEGIKPNVVLLNADSHEAIAQWKAFAAMNKGVVPVLTSATKSSDSVKHLKLIFMPRPITVKRLLTMLEQVVAASLSARTARAASVKGGGKKDDLSILVVDDSLSVRKYMELKLPEIISGPLAIEFASNGRDAMEYIWSKGIHIVFLDVVMPGMDGYNVCKAIKAEKLSDVIMLTGKKSPIDRVRGSLSGCDAYLTKPPQDRKLREVVQQSLKRLGREGVNSVCEARPARSGVRALAGQ